MYYVLYEKNNKKYLFLFGGTKIKHYIFTAKQILKVMRMINGTIAAAITDSIDGNHGSFSIEVGIGGNTVVEVSGRYEIERCVENELTA